jgi:arylsulfatase A-like enzyme
VHIPTIPDPEYVGKTRHGNWADILTQMDDFTGQILGELDTLGVAGDTIVVLASDNGGDSTYRMPAGAAPRSGRFARHADRVLCAAVVLAAVIQLAELP